MQIVEPARGDGHTKRQFRRTSVRGAEGAEKGTPSSGSYFHLLFTDLLGLLRLRKHCESRWPLGVGGPLEF